MFEREFVQDTNPNTVMELLPPDPPPEESTTTLTKIEQDTIPNIDTK